LKQYRKQLLIKNNVKNQKNFCKKSNKRIILLILNHQELEIEISQNDAIYT